MTKTAATIVTVDAFDELVNLPQYSTVTDAAGHTYMKHCTRPTNNPNWMYWECDGEKVHSDDVPLPVTVYSIPETVNFEFSGVAMQKTTIVVPRKALTR